MIPFFNAVQIFASNIQLISFQNSQGARFLADPNADMQAYCVSVIDVLNATPSESFFPTISQLDSLIQSMRINP